MNERFLKRQSNHAALERECDKKSIDFQSFFEYKDIYCPRQENIFIFFL